LVAVLISGVEGPSALGRCGSLSMDISDSEQVGPSQVMGNQPDPLTPFRDATQAQRDLKSRSRYAFTLTHSNEAVTQFLLVL
jgi:hypothetical protein